ncbi:MAG: OmpA family protein [Chitinophagales bacterium]
MRNLWILLWILLVAALFTWLSTLCCFPDGLPWAVADDSSATEQVASPYDKNAGWLALAGREFTFPKSNFVPTVPKRTATDFNQLAAWLKNNPNKQLTLVGKYAGSEQNPTQFPNLGVARADTIKQILVKAGANPQQIATAGLLKDDLKFGGNKLRNGIIFQPSSMAATPDKVAATKRYIHIQDGADFQESADDNITFKRGDYSVNQPIPAKVQRVYTKTAQYLKANPNKALRLWGYYYEDEKNTSIYANMGLARANALKAELRDKYNISEKQIVTEGYLLHPNDKSNPIVGGIYYDFARPSANAGTITGKDIGDVTNTTGNNNNSLGIDTTSTGEVKTGAEAKTAAIAETNRLQAIKDRIQRKPIILYFETNQASIQLDEEQRKDFIDIMEYLGKVDAAKLTITGHTDSRGAAATNKRLGQGRAEFAKDYLVRNGISTTRLEVSSKGETQPVADNTTKAGQAKNRRTVVTFK